MRAVAGVLIVVLLLSACGCSRAEMAFPSVVWRTGDRAEFALQVNGQDAGTTTITYERKGEGWEMSMETLGPVYRERVVIHTGPYLQPQRTEFKYEDETTTDAFVAEYKDTEAVVTGPGAETRTVRLTSPPFYDNEQLLMVVRGLKLHEDYRARMNLIVTRTGRRSTINLRVVDREPVSVPAGQFEAYKVEIVGQDQYAWVAVEAPYQLVKFVNDQTGTTMLLSDHDRGGQ